MALSNEEANRRIQLFDWDKMRYASDRVTIDQLRKVSGNSISFKDRFDVEEKLCFSPLSSIVALERQLAHIAFCQSAEIPERTAGILFAERDEIIEFLKEEYSTFQVTSGEVETREWIKYIEGQAKAQAKPFVSQSLG